MEIIQTNKKIFSITKAVSILRFDWTSEEITTFEISRTCSVNQRKLRKNGIAIEEMHAIYHDKDSKTHWNTIIKQLFIRYPYIMITTDWRTRRWKYNDWITTAIHQYTKRGNTPTITWCFLIHAKIIKNINMQQVTF